VPALPSAHWRTARARVHGSALLFAALCASAPATVRAQAIATPQGPVEFVGLETWTPERLMDSLAVRVPAASPADFPGALLDMGFARARADRMAGASAANGPGVNIPPTGAPPLTVVTVVEASHASDLSLRRSFSASEALPARWSAADSLFRQYNPAFLGAVSVRWLGQTAALPRPPTLGTPEDQARAEGALELLGELRTSADLEAGLRLLSGDTEPAKRALAAAVLGGFPEEEEAWRGLVQGLLDADPSVSAFASQALGSMVAATAQGTEPPREVDWAPTVGPLRSLVAGANLAAFPLVLQTLTSTGISPDLAPALLRGNAHLVLGYMGSSGSPERETVHRFLARIRGQDLGMSVAPWRAWIEGL
jgi:hypothetical protein